MPRILNVVEDSWGRSTVFQPEKSIELIEQEISPVHFSLSDIQEEKNDNGQSSSEDDLSDRTIYTTLPYLQSSLFATILEDTITQFRILVECNNELRIIKTKSDWNYLLSIKYGIKQPESVDELEGINPQNLGCNEYKIIKLDSDRKYVNNVIMATYVDLSLHKTFRVLEDSICTIIDRDDYRKALEEDEAKNKIVRRDLNRQLRQQRNHIKTVLYDTNAKIDALKTQVEDSLLNSECESRYVENWQRARTEQHIQTIHDNETVYSETVEYFKQRTDHEQRVHMEIDMLINIAINETLEKVENWMEKYDRDMEAIDLKIQIQKNDYQNMYDKRIKLEETIENHDKLMTDWIHFKEEREKARLYREKMTNSAITVQAWWRGLLVRRQLGPYKVAKKGKGAAKNK